MLGLARLARSLDQRLRLLTRSAKREAPARQQTLRAALEWSHALLEPVEQVTFRRLAATLQRLGLVRFALDRCTGSMGGEFFATLRACSAEEATAAAEAGDVVQLRGSEHAAVRASLASVRTQLTAIERSRSWRLTEPLRRVNRWRGRRADS